ncbi:hypothetical protein ACOBR2_20760 [Telmatobacter bradus]|uniref:hypothetical protein n=1 Tax=Telmatobacter bradus TaxID=474953 RepID=UPI003B429A26
MRALIIGRVMGTGLRVASRIAERRLTGEATQARPPAATSAPAQSRNTTQNARNVGYAARQGVGGFFRSAKRAGSIVWLQVTGSFFLLPVVAFAPTLWKTRLSYAHGPDHRTFISSVIVIAVFFYLSVTSFLRAARK